MEARGARKAEKRTPKNGGETVGELLQSLRKARNITGDELARRLGTSQATVSKIETGFQKPTMDYIVRFAAEIGLPKTESTKLLTRLNLLPAGAAGGKAADLLSLGLVSGDDAKRQQAAIEEFERSSSVI